MLTTFVAGAPAVTTKNLGSRNVVVNGMRCVLHALHWKDPEMRARMQRVIDAAPPGGAAMVETPDVVIVKIPRANGGLAQQALMDASLCTGDDDFSYIPLPLVPGNKIDLGPGAELLLRQANLPSSFIKTMKSSLSVTKHPFEIGFASTIHKIQGRTVHGHVIIDGALRTSSRVGGLTAQLLYVALTRVTAGQYMHFAPNMNAIGWAHIHAMRPDEHVARFNTAWHQQPGAAQGVRTMRREE